MELDKKHLNYYLKYKVCPKSILLTYEVYQFDNSDISICAIRSLYYHLINTV